MAPDRVSAALRRVVEARAKGYCEYCRCSNRFATASFAVEHIYPRAKGGETTLENLAWSCLGCNSHKQAKTHGFDDVTKQAFSLFNPRKQLWNEHFNWDDSSTLMIGKTPCGRATIVALQLNRLGVVNLRSVLTIVGKHPPK